MMNKNNILNLFIFLYAVIILKLIVFKYPQGMLFIFDYANLVPFKTISVYLTGEPTWRIAIRNLLGNIILLIPFGILFTLKYPHLRLFQIFVIGTVISVSLEISQVIFKSGVFDVDDIILNFFGVLCGYLFYKTVKRQNIQYLFKK